MKNFLSDTQKEDLTILHKKEKNRPNADCIKAALALLSDKGWTYRQIADALLLDEQSISRHISEYLSDNKVSISNGGSEGKLDEFQALELESHLKTNTYVKVSDICSYVLSQYNISYTLSGMTMWLYQHSFSYKKPKTMPAKLDKQRQQEFINKYDELKNNTPEDEPILFGDGVHQTMATKVSYGWIRKGKNKTIATIASRTRVNIMGAINLNNMQVDVDKYDTINSDSIVEFLDLLKEKYPNAPRIHFILDRGPYNKGAQTIEEAKKRNIEIHLLPPYSPNLNPIERLWKVMNEYTRNNRVFDSAKEFRQEIINFFENTWPKTADSMRSRINDNFQVMQKSIV